MERITQKVSDVMRLCIMISLKATISDGAGPYCTREAYGVDLDCGGRAGVFMLSRFVLKENSSMMTRCLWKKTDLCLKLKGGDTSK